MGWRSNMWATVLGTVLAAGTALAADSVVVQMDTARNAFQKNDLPRTAQALEAALAEVQQRLGNAFAETMPPALAGWEADPAEFQGLGQVGGGLSVTRAYGKGESTLNASLFLDSPAVEAAAALLSNPAATAALPNTRHIKVGGEDALLRFDSSTRSGEITMVLGSRVLLEVAGDNVERGEVLAEAAKGWNVARIRTLAGLASTQ